jgi:large subunit ribosomal protein L17
MNHKVRGRKFKRDHAQKKALMKHLAEAIILQEKIETTQAKAKELAPYIDRLITRAKKGDLLAAKIIHAILADEPAKKLLNDIAKRYDTRHGGYTRIIKLGARNHDAAPIALIEFV